MASEKFEVKLFSTMRLYHVLDKYGGLVCKVSVIENRLAGVFIDAVNLPEHLDKAIRVWVKNKLIECPETITVLGRINVLDTWQP